MNVERLGPQSATRHRRQDPGLPRKPEVLEREAASQAARLKGRPERRPKAAVTSCSADREDSCSIRRWARLVALVLLEIKPDVSLWRGNESQQMDCPADFLSR